MTLSPAVSPARFSDLDGALATLRAQGMRVSLARRLILQALFAAAGPLSAEQIVEAAGSTPAAVEHAGAALDTNASLDAASVYRNLEAFERAGVVRHVHLGHGPGLYALVGDGEREYLYCERCHTTIAVTPTQLDPVRASILDRFGYQARFTHFPIVGVCRGCAEQS